MSKRILVIEDSAASAEIMTDFLKNNGHSATVAATGKEGIEKAVADKPDIIVIDVMLPDINGIEVCRAIRQTLSAKETKIIMITAYIDAIDVVGARKAGADDFSVKTDDMHNFQKTLEKYV